MTTFVIETYQARDHRDGLGDAVSRISRTLASRPDHLTVRYLRSVFIPEDETCFHLIEAPTIEAVRDLVAQAQVAAERIVAAEAFSSLPGD